MKINTNNSTIGLWGNLMSAKTEDEKKKVLQDNIKDMQVSSGINKNEDDEENIGELDDSELTPKEKAMKEMIKKLRARALAERIARGQQLTNKEIKYLKKNSPELLAKAKLADRQRKALENRVKNVKTKKEAQDVLFIARGFSLSKASGEDGKELSLILNEAVTQAEKNTKSDILKKEIKEQEKKQKRHINKLI